MGKVEDGIFTAKTATLDRDTVTRLRDMRVHTIRLPGHDLSLTDAIKQGKIVDKKWIITLDHAEVDTEN